MDLKNLYLCVCNNNNNNKTYNYMNTNILRGGQILKTIRKNLIIE